jgi:CDP-diacylglycerol---glycerol-3-phosphate 3-phosphatidyltransferase
VHAVKNIPNLLSLLRLALAPLLALALCGSSLAAAAAALGIALAIETTDWLDGALARRFGWQSELGRFLDPLADSVARLTAFVALHSAGGYLSLSVLLVLLYRDQMVAYLRVDAALRGRRDVGARLSGKLKAVVQAAAILLVCAGRVAAHPDAGWLDPGLLMLWSHRIMGFAALVTLLSAVDYARGLGARPRQD